MAGPGIEPVTSASRVRRATDCATRSGSVCVCVCERERERERERGGNYTVMSPVGNSTLKKNHSHYF